MGYYVSHMIGIRIGGVFSDETDMDDLRRRILACIRAMPEDDRPFDDVKTNDGLVHYALEQWLDKKLSKELWADKGSYVVIAGVFNYTGWKQLSKFSAALSKELGTEVMHMCWDEERDEIHADVFLDGEPIRNVDENPVDRVLRRVT